MTQEILVLEVLDEIGKVCQIPGRNRSNGQDTIARIRSGLRGLCKLLR